MAEDTEQQDRTEQATPKRREDARKKGDVPRSRELVMTSVMVCGAASLLFLANPMGQRLTTGMSAALSIERADIFNPEYPAVALSELVVQALTGILPLGVMLILAAFAGAALIGGWSFSLSPLAFKGERLNPIKGIKRIFSANSLNELLKALAKFAVVAAAAIAWLWNCRDEVLYLPRMAPGEAVLAALELCGQSLLIVSATLILIAGADVPFQLWSHSRKLRMTKQEIKDEFKDTEGRPEVKSRIRSLQQQVAMRRMMEDVPDADVVITNPTHFAVALKYDDGSMGAPRVVAKGKDLIAARIRELAEEHAVPLFSAPPLARALFRSTKIGQEVPAALYTAVAQVLAYVYQVRDARAGVNIQKPALVDIDEAQFR